MSNELEHSGVLGMRWGVRRTHNKYGALTSAGEKKKSTLETEYTSLSNIRTLSPKGKQRKQEVQSEYKKLTGLSINSKKDETKTSDDSRILIKTNKHLSDMSNEELQAYNTRKALESTYLGYQPKERVSKGKQFIEAVGVKVITPVAIGVGKAYLTKVLNEKLDIKNIKEEKEKKEK